MKAIFIVAALTACAATHRGRRPTPTWRYAVDMAGMSAGAVVGMDGQFGRNDVQMLVGYGVALLFWAPCWFGAGR